jgi:hypothetical protein
MLLAKRLLHFAFPAWPPITTILIEALPLRRGRFGAAGLGWDVPLSSIRRDVRIAHRRPVNIPDAFPQPREQLTLDGTVLVRKADETGWVARNDAQLEVRDAEDGVHFDVYDGNGLHYSFSSKPDGASQPLDSGNLYLLEDIFGQGGTHVHLAYGPLTIRSFGWRMSGQPAMKKLKSSAKI